MIRVRLRLCLSNGLSSLTTRTLFFFFLPLPFQCLAHLRDEETEYPPVRRFRGAVNMGSKDDVLPSGQTRDWGVKHITRPFTLSLLGVGHCELSHLMHL